MGIGGLSVVSKPVKQVQKADKTDCRKLVFGIRMADILPFN
jgi:hypothetical protein